MCVYTDVGSNDTDSQFEEELAQHTMLSDTNNNNITLLHQRATRIIQINQCLMEICLVERPMLWYILVRTFKSKWVAVAMSQEQLHFTPQQMRCHHRYCRTTIVQSSATQNITNRLPTDKLFKSFQISLCMALALSYQIFTEPKKRREEKKKRQQLSPQQQTAE